jgi:hypothetical protein
MADTLHLNSTPEGWTPTHAWITYEGGWMLNLAPWDGADYFGPQITGEVWDAWDAQAHAFCVALSLPDPWTPLAHDGTSAPTLDLPEDLWDTLQDALGGIAQTHAGRILEAGGWAVTGGWTLNGDCPITLWSATVAPA